MAESDSEPVFDPNQFDPGVLSEMFPGMDDETIEQFLRDPALYQQQMEEHYSIYVDCIKPTLSQAMDTVWILLVCCMILRVVAKLGIPRQLIHLISCITGVIVLWKFYQTSTVYVALPCMVGFLLFKVSWLRTGGVFSILAAVYLLTCEKVFLDEQEWNKVRGSVMIVCMKMISLAFDHENGLFTESGVFEFYGYVLNPASVIFGPFLTYSNYCQMLTGSPLTFKWIFGVVKSLILSFLFLLWSTCGNAHLFNKLGENRWIVAYRDANAFRSSHYFVSFLSEASCLLSGIGSMVAKPKLKVENDDNVKGTKFEESKEGGGGSDNENSQLRRRKISPTERIHEDNKEEGKNKKDNENNIKYDEDGTSSDKNGTSSKENVETTDSNVWEFPAARPLQVEIPRSLVDVVTNWNLPMHYWLKTYIFKPTRKLGVFPAILITYFASSMLHGLNFQLSAVLLSIGIFAYIENVVRYTLAEVFNSCIQARRCPLDCHHKYKKDNVWVIAANLFFGAVAIWNLAYLGCLFDSNPEVEEKGYSMSHALRKWSNLDFINHWMMVVVLIINKMIN